jgi:cell wall-associated NlpC family hydrolase
MKQTFKSPEITSSKTTLKGSGKMKKLFVIMTLILSLAFAGVANAATSIKAVASVNVRSGASVNAPVIGHLVRGQIVPYLGSNRYWATITYKGKKAYVTTMTRYTIRVTTPNPVVPKPVPVPVPVPKPVPVPTKEEQLIAFGKQFMGAPYTFGKRSIVDGKFLSGDCSAFVQFLYGKFGVKLPWGSKYQAKIGQAVAKADLQPGDLVFTDTNRDGVVNHVSIYIGNDQLLHTYKTGVGVTISKFSDSSWDRTFVNARRVL